jgi:ADP-L-glycero-D-manno-heptose 6-epimerase
MGSKQGGIPNHDGKPKSKPKLALVTGGAGFIGSNIVAALAQHGWRVVVCDWFETGTKWQNLTEVTVTDFVAPPDLPAFLARSAGHLDAVIHMGAISATTETDVDKLVQNNIRLSLDLWTYCSENDVAFIYASSAATYGDGQQGFDDDWSGVALDRLRPLNAYGWSKLAVDRRISQDISLGLPTPPQWAGLRFFNVYGPREEHKGNMRSVVSQMTPRILAGDTVTLFRSHNPAYRDGGQLRDFIHVDDCVAVILWLLDNHDVSGVFNLGTGQARSFVDLAQASFAALGKTPDIAYIDTPEAIRAKYQYFTEANMAQLRAAGCHHEFKSLEDGVALYVNNWVQRYGQS